MSCPHEGAVHQQHWKGWRSLERPPRIVQPMYVLGNKPHPYISGIPTTIPTIDSMSKRQTFALHIGCWPWPKGQETDDLKCFQQSSNDGTPQHTPSWRYAIGRTPRSEWADSGVGQKVLFVLYRVYVLHTIHGKTRQ